jgi:serine/threonine protein kinase
MDRPLLPPSLADRFASPRLLGEGAFGTVVYAEDREAGGKPVAIKLLKAMEDPDGSWWARFQREAELTEALDSHYVVRSFGHGVTEDQPYLILEYVEGPSLEEYLAERGGKLPPEEALRIFVEVLFGLRAAHGQGVLHRDLKPENVLLRHGEEAVLTDFGLARDVASETLTATGTVMGTIMYMAPEILAGQPATARSDVYAAVCMFGELVLGEVPLGGGNVGEVYDRRERGGFLGFRTEGVSLPPQVDKLLTRALQADPAKRPVSAWEMSETLVEALEMARMQEVLVGVTLDEGPATVGQRAVSVGKQELDLDAPTQEDLAPPRLAVAEVTADSSMGMRVSDFQRAAPAPAMPPEEAEGGGVGSYALLAAFVVLLGMSFGMGGGMAPAPTGGPEVAVDPAEVRHQEAALVVRAYLARLEPARDGADPTALERFTEMSADTTKDAARDLRHDAGARLRTSFEEIQEQLGGLDLRRAGPELVDTVGRLRSLELLVHVTGEVATRGTWVESAWGDQLARVMVTWRLPSAPKAGASFREGGRVWRPIWSDSSARRSMAEAWARDGVMRSWEKSRGRPEVRGQTWRGREFLYAGDKIRPMVDVFVPDRTRWVDYWPYLEFPLEPGEGDLVLALAFGAVQWTFLPHVELIGADETVRLPVRPAYTGEQSSDIRKEGHGSVPTGVRIARSALPAGLERIRLVNLAVEGMANATNSFSLGEIFRLESGELPPEAALARSSTEEVP